jgi:hypothetical protein
VQRDRQQPERQEQQQAAREPPSPPLSATSQLQPKLPSAETPARDLPPAQSSSGHSYDPRALALLNAPSTPASTPAASSSNTSVQRRDALGRELTEHLRRGNGSKRRSSGRWLRGCASFAADVSSITGVDRDSAVSPGRTTVASA